MRVLKTALAFAASFAVVAVVTFFVVILLAGPHGGLLPESLAPVVLGLGWLAVLLLPALIARGVWRRSGSNAARAHAQTRPHG